MILKVFDVNTECKEEIINDKQKRNILEIFNVLEGRAHLNVLCKLDTEVEENLNSPLYYLNESNDKINFDYKRIAQDLLHVELKEDGTRNRTIQAGLLFILVSSDYIKFLKLEKVKVIDIETYELKNELGQEKDYFKLCVFKNCDEIKIIDNNQNIAKYWYKKFLHLELKRSSETNTEEIISLIEEDELYHENIKNGENYQEIKKETRYYLFDNKKFSKSGLVDHLIKVELLDLNELDEVYDSSSEKIDSIFEISSKVINRKYKRKLKLSDTIEILDSNFMISKREDLIEFDETNSRIIIKVEKDYISKVKQELESE